VGNYLSNRLIGQLFILNLLCDSVITEKEKIEKIKQAFFEYGKQAISF